ncbi:N-acetylmuramoyl-L-alanine amidase [Exiguobacterium antarcticum]|uniref:N-acetylmuramoyl-L-alanine amidase n=1 Tax=Exiguobacterium antarcticum TaxID=132920 RepID=A0ABT6QZQ1_9BACL|nr:N-acetylmuramoyl-L-alanine amidase [Exiguobacterium antarcticum]MDI3234158.1 N-acetylmuramoyl-L-alanine amidase [Exiguobacterium antarcticum]
MAKLVALDAGHGINTAGKRTPDNEREWSFNNQVLLAAQKRLAEYEDVKVLRLDDPTGKTDVPLIDRTNKANKAKADVLVSIHHNANTGKWGNWTGTETFTYTPASANPKSVALAKAVHPKLVKAMGLNDRGLKAADFHMVRESKMPAILTEGGYMDSVVDIKALRSDARLKLAGIAIADGVAAYLGLKLKAVEKPKPTPTKPKPAPTQSEALKPVAKDDMYRVKVEGKQVGAYASDQNVLEQIEKALKGDKKKIEVERV